MKVKCISLSIIAILVYCVVSYYGGLRIFQSFSRVPGWTTIYLFIYVLLTAAYPLGRMGAVLAPSSLSDTLIRVGAAWLGMIFYLTLFWLCADLAVLLGKMIGIFSSAERAATAGVGSVVVIAAGCLTGYGLVQARRIRLQRYVLTIPKECSLPSLHIVMVSDLHLGLMIGRDRLAKLVQMINELNPDIVVLPGDILDETVGAVIEAEMPALLRQLQAPLGVYGCLGSHEYILGRPERALQLLQQAGVTILQDQCVCIGNSFYLAGRDDKLRKMLTGTERKALADVLADCNRAFPILLLDHQPKELEEAQRNHVDLQLSGHTHQGQLFPVGLLTKWMYTIDWGYWRKGTYQLIVSSGVGTYGPPVRVGTTAEVVSIRVRFGLPADT